MGRTASRVTYEDGPGIHDWYFWDAYIRHVLKWLEIQPSPSC